MDMELRIYRRKNGIKSADGLDLYFYNKAKRDGKQTGGLEDVYRHVELIASLEEEIEESIYQNARVNQL